MDLLGTIRHAKWNSMICKKCIDICVNGNGLQGHMNLRLVSRGWLDPFLLV